MGSKPPGCVCFTGCRRPLKFVFEETTIPEIVAVIEPENLASQHVLEKSGFTSEGPRRAYAEEYSGFRITREQWLVANRRVIETS